MSDDEPFRGQASVYSDPLPYDIDTSQLPVDPKFDQAMYLLQTTHSLSLNYSNIQDLCDSTQSLLEKVLSKVQNKVFLALEDGNITCDRTLRNEIEQACTVTDVFKGLTSRAPREAYYKSHFNYVVCMCYNQATNRLCTHF